MIEDKEKCRHEWKHVRTRWFKGSKWVRYTERKDEFICEKCGTKKYYSAGG